MGISGSTVAVTAELPGDTEVLHALLHRRRAGSRDDGNRIALVVNGGGMRGAYAGGMVHALEEAGLRDTFDVVYGSSAGAFVAIGLLLGNGRGAAHIFFEDMASRSFIDPRRMGAKRPMVSLDHLMDHILVHPNRCRGSELRDCPIPVKVVATAADDLSAHVLQPRTVQEWQLAMRATSTIPVLAGPPVGSPAATGSTARSPNRCPCCGRSPTAPPMCWPWSTAPSPTCAGRTPSVGRPGGRVR